MELIDLNNGVKMPSLGFALHRLSPQSERCKCGSKGCTVTGGIR